MEAKSLIVGLIIGFILGVLILHYFPMAFSGTSFCKPKYIYNSIWIGDDQCKAICYGGFKVTSYKKANSTFLNGVESCFCDVNNCNPK